jgi:hypothetical protein
MFYITFISNGSSFIEVLKFFEGLYKQDCLKWVKRFINFILSNMKNISEDEIACPYMKCFE